MDAQFLEELSQDSFQFSQYTLVAPCTCRHKENFVCIELFTLIINCFMGPAPLGQNYGTKSETTSSQVLVANTALVFLPPSPPAGRPGGVSPVQPTVGPAGVSHILHSDWTVYTILVHVHNKWTIVSWWADQTPVVTVTGRVYVNSWVIVHEEHSTQWWTVCSVVANTSHCVMDLYQWTVYYSILAFGGAV